jgi:hypothetical protein
MACGNEAGRRRAMSPNIDIPEIHALAITRIKVTVH